jgi:flagellar assembly protein FliH
MTDKKSTLNWQRLQLADFGSTSDKIRPIAPVVQKQNPDPKGKDEHDQTQGFLQGYDDGLVAGRIEGFTAGEAAGAAEGQQAARQLLSLAASLDQSLIGLDQEIAEEILTLSLEIARQILRQTVAVKSEVVLAVVREALNQLPHQHAAIYLNPEDANLLRKNSGDQLAHAGHRINEDPLLQRGDVVIEANGAHVDATLSTRWRRIVESLGNNSLWIDDEKS